MAVTVRHPAWFGAVIRQAMVLRGHHTQADLAVASGLSVNSVVNVVTGARDTYRPSTIEHLAHGLSVPASALVALAASTRRPDPFTAAADLLAQPAPHGGMSFVIDVDAGDASVVEAALAAVLASLEATLPGLRARLRPPG
ncbi:MAG: hypothetical protein Q7V58_11385 [Actinomycetota bacterium]|nr:hypothetical protein [Actinomycetota bacterium]MDP1877508.1 hypothetical protein [Actinomycetota bacterium]